MNEDTMAGVEKKAIDRVPNWFWGIAGIAFVSSAWLFLNGLNLGSIVNRYIDVRFEERRERVLTRAELELRISKLEARLVKVEKLAHRAHNKKE